MHKKLLVLFAALVLVAGMSFAQAQDQTQFNFSVVVDPYIEVLVPVQDMAVSPYHVKGPNFEGMIGTYTGLSGGNWGGGIGDFAYANCPFSMTIAGDNLAGDGKPVYVREEVDGIGTGLNRFDKLNTNWEIRVHYNGGYPIGVYSNANNAPWTLTSANEIPHNGWIGIDFMCNGNRAAGPAANIDRTQPYNQSLDRGIYTCFLVVTLTSL